MSAYANSFEFTEKIFDVSTRRDLTGREQLELVVNFDEHVINLFKEVRSLTWLGYKGMLSMRIKAEHANTYYPFAVSLQEALRTYSSASSKVDASIQPLIAEHKREIHATLVEGTGLIWNSNRLEKYVSRVMDKVINYEEKIQGLLEKTKTIEAEIEALQDCAINREVLATHLENIQKIVDDFSLNEYSNLDQWVEALDKRIEAVFVHRLKELISKWTREFVEWDELQTEATLIECSTVHEIKLKDQLLYVDPPLEEAVAYWHAKLHSELHRITGLERVEATRFEMLKEAKASDYSNLLSEVVENLAQAYEILHQTLSQTEGYVQTWLGYQALWDTQAADVFNELGDQMELWTQLLEEIKKNRSTFDNSETEIHFGAIVVDYRAVQAKVNNKYDQWHREILNKFGSKLGENMRHFKGIITSHRQQLEDQAMDSSSADVTVFVTEIQELKKCLELWTAEIAQFRLAQNLLERQRFHFSPDWLWLDNVEGEWSTFRQILAKKSQKMEAEIPSLQAKIVNEEKVVMERVKELEESWRTRRPYSSDQKPSSVLDFLNTIEGKLKKTTVELTKIAKAKEVLVMEPTDLGHLEPMIEEIKGLREVWSELEKVWNLVEVVREVPWNAVMPKKIREVLDNALNELTSLPNRLRQYEAYESMKSQLTKLKKANILIVELKSEALKDRHWKIILQTIKIRGRGEMTLGSLWDVDLLHHEKFLHEVMGQAQGELALEEFLRQVREYWQSFNLELVNYQSKCRLIRGWEDLFAKLDEHINSLNSMKMSPHFKVFEEEVVPWEDKLQKIRVLFDVWIDVQRKWVYLEGIFYGSADIKQQLPTEYGRFKGIDTEFTSLMKKVASHPLILEVLALQGIQKTLERLSELLAKIQKALGEYLESQRQAFPRFYFVGDEDLLEIIGNSKDIVSVQRHFAKMFAGISSLQSSDNDSLEAMVARENEIVSFVTPVKISEDTAIHAWLTKVEVQMRDSLASNLDRCVSLMSTQTDILACINEFPAQVTLLAVQVDWCQRVEQFLSRDLSGVVSHLVDFLVLLAEQVLKSLPQELRKKYEQLITDLVHQRDVTRQLLNDKVTSTKDFNWLFHMRFYWHPKETDLLKKLVIEMSNAKFFYGFEYLGVSEKLVQTPLTDRCYLTLTQALHMRLGGNPFGPAGTGKTESVKALGAQLGRFVLVFNCDETFDGNAMCRIFVGLCQVGAWGCFDEFNRLEERMLSAVSQQILIIQMGLIDHLTRIELLGKEVKLKPDVGIFVTMNPDYAGRSNLPDNLKQLFRQIAMVKPDKELIAQVMLYSQGLRSAERLSTKIVSLFELCFDQLSNQPHYDFGLRALKSVLTSAGNMKRQDVQREGETLEEWEQRVLLKSVCETLVPKLVADDVPLLNNLLTGVFPGADFLQIEETRLRETLVQLCRKHNLVPDPAFIEKVMQLNQILRIHHGAMMVGPSGSGKSAAWRLLLEATSITEDKKGESYVIDPKAISKDELYGKLDSTTLDWTNGVFTQVLRKILDNVRGESQRRHWIIFDGDVDPWWAENLNSVLDDNKLLTLPNGERLRIPSNVRIMFEVETLKYATLATVSRCGMVWFSAELVQLPMIYSHYLSRLAQDEFDAKILEDNDLDKPRDPVREQCVDAVRRYFDGEESYVTKAVLYAEARPHIMEFSKIRVLEAFFALIRKGISNVLEYNDSHNDFPMDPVHLAAYMSKWLTIALMWGVGGSLNLREREKFSTFVQEAADFEMPVGSNPPLLDYEVKIEDGTWSLWKRKVPNIEIETHRVVDADVVVTTIDTLRHQEVLCSWLSEHRPFLLCGPPGSGKTMTLMATLKALPDFDMIFVNFSSSTTPKLLLKTFDHYCEYARTPNGVVLRPHAPNKWLVVFCDEINLPDEDQFGTQVVITFLRQLTEHNGFWRPSDRQWVSLERIQFVGACNPPTDAGRHPLSPRFLRHTPLIFVDFPGRESLLQIYGTFNRAMLKRVLSLRPMAQPLTEAMVEFYMRCQDTWTAEIQPHYIYSPRELTRWKYAVFEALEPVETVDDLVRLFVHEGLRLFADRMVLDEEKAWCERNLDDVATQMFPGFSPSALQRPILFSQYLTRNYESVNREDLRQQILSRLKVFYEEELDVPLVVFDSVLEHICRIDRVLRQPLGHLLLVGASGTGKTTLSRFVAWMNNLTVFQIKAGRNYSVNDFDDDLRSVMKRAGCKGEKICFIFDEGNVLSTAFLERMNALLASGEVPGLFEGEEYMSLINSCKEGAPRDGKLMDTEEDLYKSFIYNVQRNLHVVFTMNPANPDFSNRAASSPALFNRCVIDWFGNWPQEAFVQVAAEFTSKMDLTAAAFTQEAQQADEDLRHRGLVNAIVEVHEAVVSTNSKLQKAAKKSNFITPRDFLDFIKHFVNLYAEKKSELEEQQLHLNIGLTKLAETEDSVKKLQGSLAEKNVKLEAMNKKANEKLDLITTEQANAEVKREASIRMKRELEIKGQEIRERSEVVNHDLAMAEPALIEAQNAVKGIGRKQLDELRIMAQPPSLVKLTLEAVVCLVTNSVKPVEWNDIKQSMRKENFIPDIINFNTSSLSQSIVKRITKNFLNHKDWDLERIDRASKAAGPLAKWVNSQVSYADILDRVDPLRQEVLTLESQEMELKVQYNELETTIDELKRNIDTYKSDYENLIAEVATIKAEKTVVQEKVERSKNLIANLSSEKLRWQQASQDFQSQIATMVGDVLISGAFLAYVGFFDFYYRQSLSSTWKVAMDVEGLRFRQEMSIIEFLSKPSERLAWKSNRLPDDSLCVENAIILRRFNRYPLVIDPSGQATEFLTTQYAEKKIAKVSFADDAFMKNLETSLRFGCPLLVEDVEKIDPVLNSVLNRELYRTGGRILIRVGDLEIDFSPSFTMYMVTRDPNAQFTPDLCSRVTFVNFTITMSSLQSQCLNIYLKHERPDVDQKRSDLLKLQGEYKVRLRELEDSLLTALNEVRGNILDNDSVISTLETLKREAEIVAREVAQTDRVMLEIEQTSNMYLNLAVASSRIYFALEALSGVHFLYQYSLQFFMQAVFSVLSSSPVARIGAEDHAARLQAIDQGLFETVYARVSRGMLEADKLVLAIRLAQIRLGNTCEQEIGLFLKGNVGFRGGRAVSLPISESQVKELVGLAENQIYADLLTHIQANQGKWMHFLEVADAENYVPTGWETLNSAYKGTQLQVAKITVELTMLKVLRPDRLLVAITRLINCVLGDDLLRTPVSDLQPVVEFETLPKSPLLLCSAPGFDPSQKVDKLARDLNKRYTAVAIGSAEGYTLAEQAIQSASKAGHWVLLKNVHLAPGWLVELEKKIHRLTPHENFRLFLTMEINPKVPSTLVRSSNTFVFERPAGIKVSLKRSFRTLLSPERTDRAPVERSRLHFLLCWLHAVVQERLRYTPIGWTKVYEFNEADQRCTLDSIDQWIDSVSQGRTNVPPEQIPWDALQATISKSLYGGKVDNEFDDKILSSFVSELFREQSFDPNFALFNGANPLLLPEARSMAQYSDWVDNLPDSETPEWSGLPNNAEKLAKSLEAKIMLNKAVSMQGTGDEELAYSEASSEQSQRAWLVQLNQRVQQMLELLPTGLPSLHRTAQSITNPLFRFIERELQIGSGLLALVRSDLTKLKAMTDGSLKSTFDLKKLAQTLHNDVLPDKWKRFPIAPLSAADWFLDFTKRLEQLTTLASSPDFGKRGVWLGGFFFPEAFMTATRQATCQTNKWSLDETSLAVEVGGSLLSADDHGYMVQGLTLESAAWSDSHLELTPNLTEGLPPCVFRWVKAAQSSELISLPVYLNSQRKRLLLSVRLSGGRHKATTWYQRGAAVTVWSTA
jgi:dynein heavy chain 1